MSTNLGGRKQAYVTIPIQGRDFGKVFLLTEMSAVKSEKWAIRAFLALARGGIDIPPDIEEAGLMGIASLGVKIFGQMLWADAEPLIDEMFECVRAVPNPQDRSLDTELFESSIDDVSTRMFLRKKVFGLHVDFSQLATVWKSVRLASGTGS